MQIAVHKKRMVRRIQTLFILDKFILLQCEYTFNACFHSNYGPFNGHWMLSINPFDRDHCGLPLLEAELTMINPIHAACLIHAICNVPRCGVISVTIIIDQEAKAFIL